MEMKAPDVVEQPRDAASADVQPAEQVVMSAKKKEKKAMSEPAIRRARVRGGRAAGRGSRARAASPARARAGRGADNGGWSTSSARGEVPQLADLRLAKNGVRASEKSRNIIVEFDNGFKAFLLPINVHHEDRQKVRDLMVSWLQKCVSR